MENTGQWQGNLLRGHDTNLKQTSTLLGTCLLENSPEFYNTPSSSQTEVILFVIQSKRFRFDLGVEIYNRQRLPRVICLDLDFR